MNEYIPNRNVKIRPHDKPYITHACRVADRCHKRFQRTRNPHHYEIFKEKRRIAKHVRRDAKQIYDSRMMQKLTTEQGNPRDYIGNRSNL